KNYFDWIKNHPFKADNINHGILPGDFSVTIKKDNAGLGILGLNSAFLHLTDKDYKGRLAVHPSQFHQACGGDGPDWAKEHQLCLLMTHHPPSCLSPNARQHLTENITDHGRFAVHLCGGLHETAFLNSSEGGAEMLRLWQSRSLFGLKSSGKAGGYTLGKIELDGNKGVLRFWPRCENTQGTQRNFVPDYAVKLTDEQHTHPQNLLPLPPASPGDPRTQESKRSPLDSRVRGNDESGITAASVISGIPVKEFHALSKKLGVTQIALENFFGILGKGAVPLENLDSELRQVAERYKEFLSADWEQVMAQSKLSAKIKAKDEFTCHSKQSRELIKKAQRKLKYLPGHPEYLKVMLMGGTVLSSAGLLKEAEKLLLKALDISRTEEDRGLIRFNLFQINIRCRDYRKALENLQEAIKVNPGRYALHDVKKYPIERLLGAGGMGVVFLCFYPLKEKKAVVKCLWEKRKDAEKEAKIMQKAAGKHVPEVIDYDYSGSNRAYFVTEYVEGAIDGAAWLKKHGKLSLKEGVEVGLQIVAALQGAHEQGIVHLDLKPANILLKKVAERIEVKVIDFGLSRVANSLQEEAMTRQQTQLGLSVFGQGIMGTLEYAPPEQLGYVAEYGEPDAKSDVFSFGTTLYHLLTGESPRFPSPYKLPNNSELQRLLFGCVELDPKKRLDIQGVKKRLGKLAESIRPVQKEEPERERETVQEKPPKKTKRKASAAKEEKAGEVFQDTLKDGTQGPRMLHLPAGRFRMGDVSRSGYDSEKPDHEVTLNAFAIGVCPVMFAEYDLFCEAVKRDKPGDEGWGRGKRPVINVSWKDAETYCKWLSAQTKQEYRLLTEAEWEYACRAGSETAYCFGDDEKLLGDYAWYGGEWEEDSTHPAGEKKPNEFGLYDMHGNVWEWVHDLFGDYLKEAQENPKGPETGFGRVMRGGSWDVDAGDCRSAYRDEWFHPVKRDHGTGFRLARTNPLPSYPFTLKEEPVADSEAGNERKKESSRGAKDAAGPGNGPVSRKRLKKPVGVITLFVLFAALTWMLTDFSGGGSGKAIDALSSDKPLPAVTPELNEFKVFHDPLKDSGQGPAMVLLPGGMFKMGDIQGKGRDNEKPVHEVRLDDFYIGKYEVTFAEYDLFAEAAGKEKPEDQGWGREDRPAINVFWHEAAAYAKWLSDQTGHAYRLPTEAEWEYAARADSRTVYAFGNDSSGLGEYAWYWDNAEKKTHPVGEKKPNAWGLHDMHGNVWEWTQDWYGSYSSEAQMNPTGPDTGSARVIRGGSWDDITLLCHSAVRNRYGPGYRVGYLGFRLARTYP
ncbi:MAG: SUMF1/EgtB/PvdO family nonheme iron enzyme, partial [Gammaproteobacteria bacterium]|nr:SUMF1/EgtB/PvdO family nonheme iron enzyme [Gammaproteobacteria bacterium]